jgi:hypothetical protein
MGRECWQKLWVQEPRHSNRPAFACGWPPHRAESLWLSVTPAFLIFPEGLSLSALCCGRAAFPIKHDSKRQE